LKKEKPHLQVTESIRGLESIASLSEQNEQSKAKGQKDPLKARINFLDLSFRTFNAGLAPIVNFIVSLSLKIAVIAILCSAPPLFLFFTTYTINPLWYGLCAFACSLSVSVFVIGQYGAWRLWCESKKEANKSLNSLCKLGTDGCKELDNVEGSEKHPKIKRIRVDPNMVRKLQVDINSLSAMTYTSSALFKIIAANFLAFGPIIIEQILSHLLR
jgi:hypothetical protein